MQLTCFPNVVQLQYVGEVGKCITVVLLLINLVDCGPNITEVNGCGYCSTLNNVGFFRVPH